MTKIAVNGALGRMGSRILALAKESKEFEIAGEFDANGEKLSADKLKKGGKGVLIDFSSPEGTSTVIPEALQAGWGLVVGTTGLEAKQFDALKKAAQQVPVVVSGNMSIGVNLVLELLALLSKKAPDNFDIRITETHHIHKKDAPSGTALMLLNAIGGSKRWDAERMRKERERIHSIREGEIVGDHSVLFSGPAETIEIKHHAHSRDIFAGGALTAAKFVSSASPALYSTADVLKK